ncbi:MAG TPA: hypothetical protein VMV49_12275, partial [Candidatus Deferrimicrobium sp.]|nr:hypothetical protein [Candidatus Deferrimicrobium sp.]
GFLAYIKNLVNIALDMSKSLKIKEEKFSQQILSAFEFTERIIQLFEYCESYWTLSEIIILLKEIIRRLQRDLSSLPIDFSNWVSDLEQELEPDAILPEQKSINLEYDAFLSLEKASQLIRSNLEMYKSAFQDDIKTVPMIEEKYKNLLFTLGELERKYSKKILKFMLVIETRSGVTLFQHNFSETSTDPDLISGFLSAVQSFGTELTNEGSDMKKLAYKDFEIEMNIGDYIRVALFLKGQNTKYLVKNLVNFINAFERKYEDSLKQWMGDVSKFRDGTILVKNMFW